ncbi:hypothetical protein PM082_010079 [Marasmius tenuissimus]|nr:hypothetical protein PM082_010079 [Marasmius tenuissimus]
MMCILGLGDLFCVAVGILMIRKRLLAEHDAGRRIISLRPFKLSVFSLHMIASLLENVARTKATQPISAQRQYREILFRKSLDPVAILNGTGNGAPNCWMGGIFSHFIQRSCDLYDLHHGAHGCAAIRDNPTVN